MEPATSDDLNKRGNKLARTAVESGQPVPVTFHSKPYVRIVPDDLWERAFAALQREEAAKKKAS